VFFSQIPSYYSSIDFSKSGNDLKSDLSTLISSNYTAIKYSHNSQIDTWDILQESDLLSGDNVLLLYGYNDSDNSSINDRLRDKNDIGTSGCTGFWNREHVFPKSLASPVLTTDSPGTGTDLHNLRAADCQMNSTRNNNEYDLSSGNAALTTNGFYPGDEYKGDVARIIMYMYTRYPSQCQANDVGYGTNVYNDNIPCVDDAS
jgi:endonuclease I